MSDRKAVLREVRYPDIGFPAEPRPEVPDRVFAGRLARLRERMAGRGLDAFVVYGDREHFANLHYLTNYDPRFEEALLVVLPQGRPSLLVGNEGMGYSTIARLEVERVLYQTFSLLGQPREGVRPLSALLREAGMRAGIRVGAAGWKYFSEREFAGAGDMLDLPYFITMALRAAVAPGGRVSNETALFMDPETGLRAAFEPEQLADFEWVATSNSQALLEGIRVLRPGMTEMDAYRGVPYNGLPFCCHPVLATGERVVRHGFPSPSSRVIQAGDPILMTLSYQGANTCRFGWVAAGPDDLPDAVRDYVQVAAAPYTLALAAWYETLRAGATGGELFHAVADRVAPLGFHLGLNPGHLIGADEWIHSPVANGSEQQVVSGSYWQADFFPVLQSPHYGAFAEDGVVVAAAPLRTELQQRYPVLWRRVEARRRFLTRELGFRISPDLLPLSNFPAAVIPYFLAPERCMGLGK